MEGVVYGLPPGPSGRDCLWAPLRAQGLQTSKCVFATLNGTISRQSLSLLSPGGMVPRGLFLQYQGAAPRAAPPPSPSPGAPARLALRNAPFKEWPLLMAYQGRTSGACLPRRSSTSRPSSAPCCSPLGRLHRGSWSLRGLGRVDSSLHSQLGGRIVCGELALRRCIRDDTATADVVLPHTLSQRRVLWL